MPNCEVGLRTGMSIDIGSAELTGAGLQLPSPQQCPSCGEGAVDLLCADWDRVLAATADNADIGAFNSSADDCAVNEKRLQLFILRFDAGGDHPIAATTTVPRTSTRQFLATFQDTSHRMDITTKH